MGKNPKMTGRAVSMPKGLAASAVVSILLTLLVAVILSKLIDTGKMAWEKIGYGIMAETILVSFIGARIACLQIKRQQMLVCLLSGIIYYGLLIASAILFFGGQLDGMGVTALLILAGCGSASLIRIREQGSGGYKVRKKRYR